MPLVRKPEEMTKATSPERSGSMVHTHHSFILAAEAFGAYQDQGKQMAMNR
jgi:hypothetical protein